MEDLAQSWKRLSLSEREGPGCCLTTEECQTILHSCKIHDEESYQCQLNSKDFHSLVVSKKRFQDPKDWRP